MFLEITILFFELFFIFVIHIVLRLSPGEYILHVLFKFTGYLFKDKFNILFVYKSPSCVSLFDLIFDFFISLLELSPLLFLFFNLFLFLLTECTFWIKLIVSKFLDIFFKLFFTKIYIIKIYLIINYKKYKLHFWQ